MSQLFTSLVEGKGQKQKTYVICLNFSEYYKQTLFFNKQTYCNFLHFFTDINNGWTTFCMEPLNFMECHETKRLQTVLILQCLQLLIKRPKTLTTNRWERGEGEVLKLLYLGQNIDEN